MQNLLHQDDSHATMRTLTQNVRPIAHLKNGRPCANSPLRVLGKPQWAASRAKEGEAVLTSDTSNAAEEWRPVVGYEGYYEVSNLGRVRRSYDAPLNGARDTRGKILKPDKTHPYARVNLYRNGTGKRALVHRLVAKAFMQPWLVGAHINHIDGNKRNNCLANLEWCTAAENTRHAWAMGLCTANRGEKHGQAKLTDRDIEVVRDARSRGIHLATIAKVFNVSESTISAAARFQTWIPE